MSMEADDKLALVVGTIALIYFLAGLFIVWVQGKKQEN